MEENLKNLLKEIIEQENLRNDKLQAINQRLEAINIQEETRIERFEQGFLEDVNSGVYNMTDGQIKKALDEGKAKISQEFNNERATIKEEIAKLQEENEKENKNRNPKITNALNQYKAELITDQIELKREIKNVEQEKTEKLQEIDRQKAEKEARYTHLIMRNRNVIDSQNRDSGDIMILAREIEELKSQRDEIVSSFDTQISELNSQEDIINNNLQKVNVFFSSIRLSEKTTSEIYEMLFEKEKQEEPKQEEPVQEKTQKNTINPIFAPYISANKPEAQEKVSPKETKPSSNKQKFSYEFSIKGIKYDGKDIDINDLLYWNEEHEDSIKAAIKAIMGDKEETEDFLDFSDKLIYTSIILQGSTITRDGKLEIDPDAKDRLKTYYDIWTNPKSQDESNMSIKYNLKGTSAISRLFRKWAIIDEETFSKWELIDEEMQNIRDNAFELRNRKNVTIEKGLFTKVQFKVREMIQNQRKIKKLDTPKQEPKENNSHKKFLGRLNPESSEYSHVEPKTSEPEKVAESEKESFTR